MEGIIKQYIESRRPVPAVNEAPCEDCGETTDNWFSSWKMNKVTFRCEKCLKERTEEQEKMMERLRINLETDK